MRNSAIIRILTAVLVLALFCSGCGIQSNASVRKKFDADTPASSISTQNVSENNAFKLDWDDEKKCILFENKSTGKIWSNIPYEYYLSGGASTNVNSTLNITVADATSLQLTTVRGYTEAVQNGRIFSEKITDGIRVTYYFDNYSVSIPVEYTLCEDSMVVTIDTPEIREGSDFLLVSVELAPFLCSSQNTQDDDYLFVPSGSGALMYARETTELERTFSAEVYGKDASRPLPEVLTNDESVRIPVFGVKSGENAMLGIIGKNAGAAVLEASSGNSRTGYSNIYPVFYFRGYDVFDKGAFKSLKDDLTRVSSNMSQTPVSVGYYPLSGEKANYNGMAECYRNYLKKNSLLRDTSLSESPYSLTILGGVLTTSSIFGIPKKTLKSMTTFSQAGDILSDITELTGILPNVRMSGYGNYGINPGMIAGGYEFASKLGSSKDMKAIEAFCSENGGSLYTDFELIKYSKSGNGFSYLSDCAKTAVLKSAEQYPIETPLRTYDETLSYRLLSRSALSTAMSDLVEYAKNKSISGLSLTSLGTLAYSDYSDVSYVAKGKIENDVSAMLESALNAGFNVATGPNSYAATLAETVFDVPTDDGEYNAFDAYIPFYSMVFRGSRTLYSNAINLTADSRKQLAEAVAGGTGLGFTIISDFEETYMETGVEKLYGAVYEDNKNLISEYVGNYSELYSAVKGKQITDYELITADLSKTVYENGVTVYVNHSGNSSECPLGTLGAYEYLWK